MIIEKRIADITVVNLYRLAPMDRFVFYAEFTMCLLFLYIKLNVDSDMYAMHMCLCSTVKLKKLKTQCVYMHIITLPFVSLPLILVDENFTWIWTWIKYIPYDNSDIKRFLIVMSQCYVILIYTCQNTNVHKPNIISIIKSVIS